MTMIYMLIHATSATPAQRCAKKIAVNYVDTFEVTLACSAGVYQYNIISNKK